jgi:hypothetical protein
MDATCRPCETKLAQSEGNLRLLKYLKIIKKSLRNKPTAYRNIRVHTRSNCQVARCRAASGWCGLLMAGADCRWQIRVLHGGYGLSMCGAGLVVGRCVFGCCVVAGLTGRC